MLRRHFERVAGHPRVWVAEVYRFDRQQQSKREKYETEEPPDQIVHTRA